MKKILLACLLISIKAMAQNSTPDHTTTSIQSSRSWTDIDYVGDGITGHFLDVHLPLAGKGPYPVVICIYGSAWFSNNFKGTTFTTGLGQYLLKEGFAVVTVNYRSSNDAKFPAQIQDVKAAIRFIKANCKMFSLDSSFVGVTGWSSGGHLKVKHA